MLIERQRWAGIQDGSITVLFRRWRHRQARAGNTYRTAAGRILVEGMDRITEGEIVADDARAAGYASAEEAIADLRGAPGDPLYRLRIRLVTEPDPRDELALSTELDEVEIARVAARLGRMDRASRDGPWTDGTLRIIESRPATRAQDLADALGRDRMRFKTDVRKLKNLGLTISLETGYRLSPRGAAFLRCAGATSVTRARARRSRTDPP
jgi:hypothetical protein